MAAIAGPGLFEYDATDLAHLCLGRFYILSLCSTSQPQSGWRGMLSWISLGSDWATQGHSELSYSHSFDVLAVCLGSMSCRKLIVSTRSRTVASKFSSTVTSMIFSNSCCWKPSPQHDADMTPHCREALVRWWVMPDLLRTSHPAFRSKSVIFVSKNPSLAIIFIDRWPPLGRVL